MRKVNRDEFQALVKEARISVRLRRELRYIPENMQDWPARDFITVTTRSGLEGVLIAPFDALYVVPFQLQKRIANSLGRTEAIICDFCATWQRGTNSVMLSFSKQRSSVSFLCCGDLLCSLHVRDKTSAALLSRTQLRETTTPEVRIERLRARLESILRQIC